MKKSPIHLLRGYLFSLMRTLRRFPLPTLFILLLTLKTLLALHGMSCGTGHEDDITFFYLSGAALLATVTAVWGETQRSKRLRYGVTLATQLIWLGNAAYLFGQPAISLSLGVANGTSLVLLVAALPGLPYLHRHNELAFRRFCSRLVFSAIAAGLVGLCFFAGVTVLSLSLEPLFGIRMGTYTVETIATLFFVFCAPMVFLSRMPSPDALGQEQHAVSPLTRYAVRYVINPLLCAYAALLYVYAAYILLTWNLPNGWVSALVSALMGGVVLTVYLFLPLRRTDGWERDDFVARYGPALLLPLLVLMSIGIGRRLYDYGLTVRRLYLLLFNLWCYAACFYMIFTRSRRVKWLLLSPFVLGFLASVGPWNIVGSTQRVLAKEVKRALDASGVAACPMDKTAYGHTLEAMTDETARFVNDKLDYMLSTYGRKSVAAFIKDDVDPHHFGRKTTDDVQTYSQYFTRQARVSLTDSVAHLRHVDETQSLTALDLRRDTVYFFLKDAAASADDSLLRFDIPLGLLRSWDNADADTAPPVLHSHDRRAHLAVEGFYLDLRTDSRPDDLKVNSLTLEGILLTK